MSYVDIKALHVAAVVLSVGLFAVRGILMWRQSTLTNVPWLARTTHVIDTVLLGAALGLVWIGGRQPLVEPWLQAKLGYLLAYIVLGALALKRAPTLWARRVCFGLAVLVVGQLLATALSKDPRGLIVFLH